MIMNKLEPGLVYFPPADLMAGVERDGPIREIEVGGRSGINATSAGPNCGRKMFGIASKSFKKVSEYEGRSMAR